MKKEYQLYREEIEDLEVAIENFEKDYNIVLGENIDAKNFQELSDYILNKFDLEYFTDCTTQQAFYKLRQSIKSQHICDFEIKPSTSLETIFPKEKRKEYLAKIYQDMGAEVSVLRPKLWIEYIVMVFSMVLLVNLFLNFWWGVLGLVICWFLVEYIFDKGNEFRIKTVRDLVNEMVWKNYFKMRRNSKSMNKEEFKNIIIEYFSEEMCLDKEDLKRAKIVY